MKKLQWLLLAVIGILFFIGYRSSRLHGRISSLTSTVIQLDGTFLVHEKIDIIAEKNINKNTLFRDFTNNFFWDDLYCVLSNVNVVSVKCNGNLVPWDKDDRHHYRQLIKRDRIDIKNPLLLSGKHTFEIAYVIKGIIIPSSKCDRIYWNVTGLHWSLPIDKVEVVLFGSNKNFLNFNKLDTFIRKKGWGKKENLKYRIENNCLKVATESSLLPGEGLVMNFNYDKNLFFVVPSDYDSSNVIEKCFYITTAFLLTLLFYGMFFCFFYRFLKIKLLNIRKSWLLAKHYKDCFNTYIKNEQSDIISIAQIIDLEIKGIVGIKSNKYFFYIRNKSLGLVQTNNDDKALEKLFPNKENCIKISKKLNNGLNFILNKYNEPLWYEYLAIILFILCYGGFILFTLWLFFCDYLLWLAIVLCFVFFCAFKSVDCENKI